MQKLITLLLLVSCSFGASAQTRKIAHRSHSGSNHTLTNNGDNFGLPSKPKDTAVKKTPPVVTKKTTKHKKRTKKVTAVPTAGR